MAQSTKLPTNPIGLYWAYWNPYTRLVNLPQVFNMLFLFHAYPADGEAAGGDTGAVVLRKPTGDIGANLNTDIATCRARGQRVMVSIGGAGGATYIQTQARADAFIQSIKDINVGLGGSGTTAAFDGIDWNNFELTSISGQEQWMTYAGQQLKAYYGSDFIISSPPSCSTYLNQRTLDRELLAALYAGGALDWVCPQFYDGDGTNVSSWVQNTLDFYNTSVTVNGQSVQIPRNHIGVGYRLGTETTSWTAANAAAAYTAAVNAGKQPKGAFNWAVHLDTNNSFATTVAPVITNNVSGTSPAFTLSLSPNVVNGAPTTQQLTAPSGKTNADFQAGVVSESTNPITIDLGENKFTEIEWCVKATDAAEDAAQYQFRVTYQGQPLDGYTVYPTWTIGSGAQPPVDPPNSTGAYLVFDGDGDYVEIPDNDTFSIPTTGEITIAASIRPDTLLFTNTESAGAEGTYVMWMGKGGYHTVNNLEWGFRMYSNDGNRPNRISFYVFNLVGGLGVGSYFQDVVIVGEWIRVMATVDSTYTRIYKNGVFRDQDEYPSYPIVPENSYEPLRIGTMTKNGFFKGAIDNVCIWNRKLSDAEALQDAQGILVTSGLTNRYKFDDASGNTAVDSVGGINGTLYPGNGQPQWNTIVTPPPPTTSTPGRKISGLKKISGMKSIRF